MVTIVNPRGNMGHMEQSHTGGATPPIPVPPTNADLIHRLRGAGTAIYLATDRTVADDVSGLLFAAAARIEQHEHPDLPIGAEPVDEFDPRYVYPDYPQEKVHAAWPCAWCSVRRDEHASDPTPSAFPELDITDHVFTPAYTLDISSEGRWVRIADGSPASDMEAAAAIWGTPAVDNRKADQS